MFTINYIESDPNWRSLVTSNLSEQGIVVQSETEASAASLVLLAADEPDFEQRVERVRRIREQFPTVPIAVISKFFSVQFIYEIAEIADAVFVKQHVGSQELSWENFAAQLQRVTRT